MNRNEKIRNTAPETMPNPSGLKAYAKIMDAGKKRKVRKKGNLKTAVSRTGYKTYTLASVDLLRSRPYMPASINFFCMPLITVEQVM